MPNINSNTPTTEIYKSKSLLIDGWHRPIIGSHVGCAILGDSISSRTFDTSIIAGGFSAAGLWNPINWLSGCPVVYTTNLAVPGDKTRTIFSRISSIPNSSQLVVILSGTNDVLSMSSSAPQATIDSTYTTLSSIISTGVSNLVDSGKVVVISTILPNNAYSSSSDSRIQLLDMLNAFILSLHNGSTVFAVDGFTSIWDSSQPTIRVAKTDRLNSDGTHLTNLGCWDFGIYCSDIFKNAVSMCSPSIDLYKGYQQINSLYGEFFRSTGGTAGQITAGTGTLADGWRSLNTAGDATIVLDATEVYSKGASFIGNWNDRPNSPISYFQKVTVTNAESGDVVEIRGVQPTSTGNVLSGIFGGSSIFFEIEVIVESGTNLGSLEASVYVFFTSGTSPADIPYAGTTYVCGASGVAEGFASVVKPIPVDSGLRMVMRSCPISVPENINGSVAIYANASAFLKFCGAGGAVVKLAKPRIWSKCGRFIN